MRTATSEEITYWEQNESFRELSFRFKEAFGDRAEVFICAEFPTVCLDNVKVTMIYRNNDNFHLTIPGRTALDLAEQKGSIVPIDEIMDVTDERVWKDHSRRM